MAVEPLISWFEGTNTDQAAVTGVINYGTVESDSESNHKVFFVWNNKNGTTDVPTMEEVSFTTRDRDGGNGDTAGMIVEAVRDNWMNVRVDSLNEQTFTAVGRGGSKPVGTNGSTTNPKAATAVVWSANTPYTVGQYIKPTGANGFIYRVTKGGTSGGTQPTWSTSAGNVVSDGTVEYATVAIVITPAAFEILGVANTVAPDGSNATSSGGNFIKLTVYGFVPPTASSGKNEFLQRISYKFV